LAASLPWQGRASTFVTKFQQGNALMNGRSVLAATTAAMVASALTMTPASAHDGRNAALIGGLVAGALLGAAGAAAAGSPPPPPDYYYGGPPPGYGYRRYPPPGYYPPPPPPGCGYYPYPPCRY
jgi:hypothetical protein